MTAQRRLQSVMFPSAITISTMHSVALTFVHLM